MPITPDNLSLHAIVGDDAVELDFTTDGSSLQIDRIVSKASGRQHLTQPAMLLSIAVGELGAPALDEGWAVDSYRRVGADSLRVEGSMRAQPVTLTLEASPAASRGSVAVRLRLRNDGDTLLQARVRLPDIERLQTHDGSGRPLQAAVPQEAGGIASYREKVCLGMSVNAEIGLPNAMNLMELVSLYDPDAGGGVYFMDGGGEAQGAAMPIQFVLEDASVRGYWTTDLPPGSEMSLPPLVIGVHERGDWRVAVDEYNRLHPAPPSAAEIPAWLRDQGAIYSFSGGGAGSIYMEYPHRSLDTRIQSFLELPALLDEAWELGTNIVYLWDYWEGAEAGGHPAYWNKGDYAPRRDLGGPAALREGIRRVHDAGGRVILYLEWFIIYWHSDICKRYGEEWAARNAQGEPYSHYRTNYSLSPLSDAWRRHIIDVAVRLTRDYGVDGIYLDSMGWQFNWPVATRGHSRCSSAEYTRGALALVEELRSAIRAVRPDAAAIGETTSGPLRYLWDGGLSADFAWLRTQNQGRLLASPARCGAPHANIYGNGHDRNEMNQVFAAGHSLALADIHLSDADYVRRLVRIRQTFKDALIYGKQSYPAHTHAEAVAAYLYEGARHDVIALVNASGEPYAGVVEVEPSAGSVWRSLLTGTSVSAEARGIGAAAPPKSLLVCARRRGRRRS